MEQSAIMRQWDKIILCITLVGIVAVLNLGLLGESLTDAGFDSLGFYYFLTLLQWTVYLASLSGLAGFFLKKTRYCLCAIVISTLCVAFYVWAVVAIVNDKS